jgi:hypothetical protein
MTTLDSTAQTIADAQAQVANALAFVQNGDQAVTANAAIQSYQQAANAAQQATMLCGSVTAVLISSTPSVTAQDAAINSLIQSSTQSDDDAGTATTPAVARAAAVQGIQSAQAAIPLAQQAAAQFTQPPRVTFGWLAAGVIVAIAGVVTYVKLNPKRKNPINRDQAKVAWRAARNAADLAQRTAWAALAAKAPNTDALIDRAVALRKASNDARLTYRAAIGEET